MSVIIVERNHTYALEVSLTVHECPACGIVYGIPNDFRDACRRNGTRYYCPNGHSLGWQETDADRERVLDGGDGGSAFDSALAEASSSSLIR